MVDVASVSVLSSGVVAIASLGVTAWASSAQRRHDAAQAYQGRVWEAKSEALLGIIRVSLPVVRVVEARYALGRLAQDLILAKEFIEQSAAELETYGSKATRDALRAFAGLIEQTPIQGSHTAGMLHSVRDLKRRSVAQQDYDEAAVARKQEKDMLTAIADGLPKDPSVYRDAAQALIDAARGDLRSPDA